MHALRASYLINNMVLSTHLYWPGHISRDYVIVSRSQLDAVHTDIRNAFDRVLQRTPPKKANGLGTHSDWLVGII